MNKKVSDSGNMTKNNEVTENKVSGNYGSESNSEEKTENYNDIIKNVVLENKVVNVESDNEDCGEVELLTSADEAERESMMKG